MDPGHAHVPQHLDAIAEAATQAAANFSSVQSPERGAFEAGVHAARQVGKEVEALICATDQVAMGALHTLGKNGDNLAVTGFDDIDAAGQFIPGITTIRQPTATMALAAVEAVVQKKAPAKLFLKPELIVRESG